MSMGYCCLVTFVLLFACGVGQVALPSPGDRSGNAKWVRISRNLVLTTPDEVFEVVDSAKAQGANGVVFSDVKAFTWWFRSPGAVWLERMKAVRDGVRDRNMDFILSMTGIGYCSGHTAFDPNLAAGYPLVNVPLRVTSGNVLTPVETAEIPNGGFENANGNDVADWDFQDAPGERTFVDSTVSHSGSKSLRFDVKPNQNSRIFGEFPVNEFQQYTITVWIKAQDLTSQSILVLIRDAANTDRNLGLQSLSTPRSDGGRSYFERPDGLTLDWTEMKLSFNSMSATSISLVFGVYGGVRGKVWWDDVRINSTPLLNLVRRNSLPFGIQTSSGRSLSEGTDYTGAEDAKLGQSVFQGNFDTYHDVAPISVRSSARLSVGDVVTLNGYHTVVTLRGQVGCTWSDRGLFRVTRRAYANAQREFKPDGYLLGHDEIRTGGWEPAEVARGRSGKALAGFFRRDINVIRKVTGDLPYLYIWSDMLDPQQNAVDLYFHVRDSLAGSFRGVARTKAVILNWKESDLATVGEDSISFFINKGYTQVIAAFYDRDVQDNFNQWQSAINGRAVAGSMYTTWTSSGDYSQLAPFGNLWW